MDLMYHDVTGTGILKHYSADFDVGAENDFEIDIAKKDWPGAKYVYVPGTELGGPVRKITTDGDMLKITGPTWRGALKDTYIKQTNPKSGYRVEAETQLLDALSQILFADNFAPMPTAATSAYANYVITASGEVPDVVRISPFSTTLEAVTQVAEESGHILRFTGGDRNGGNLGIFGCGCDIVADVANDRRDELRINDSYPGFAYTSEVGEAPRHIISYDDDNFYHTYRLNDAEIVVEPVTDVGYITWPIELLDVSGMTQTERRRAERNRMEELINENMQYEITSLPDIDLELYDIFSVQVDSGWKDVQVSGIIKKLSNDGINQKVNTEYKLSWVIV